MEKEIFNFKITLEEDWQVSMNDGQLKYLIPYGAESNAVVARIQKIDGHGWIEICAYERNVESNKDYLRDMSFEHIELGCRISNCRYGEFEGVSTFWLEGEEFVKQWNLGSGRSVISIKYTCLNKYRKLELKTVESMLSTLEKIDLTEYHKEMEPKPYVKDRTRYAIYLNPRNVDKKIFVKLLRKYKDLSVIDAMKLYRENNSVVLLDGRGTPIYKACSELHEEEINFIVDPAYPHIYTRGE